MTRVTINSDLSAKLSSYLSPVELCDESGRKVGTFQPALSPEELKRILAERPYSEEELKRRRQVRTGRPLADILKDLQELGQ